MEGNIIIANIGNLTIDDDNDDRISDLPDSIAHHILFYLLRFPKELIRMSLLSKKWLSLTASLPIFDFDIVDFIRAKYPLPGVPDDLKYAKDMFFKYVEYTTSRFSQQQNVVSANTLNLCADLKDSAHAAIIDRCLGLILKQGLQEFHIFDCGIDLNDDQQPPAMYPLPDKLLSLSSLMYMRIHYCTLPSSLTVDDNAVKFKSLKGLHLDHVYLNEEMIKRLTSGCPLLEVFQVQFCYGFKSLRLYGIHNLQIVSIRSNTHELEEIDIQAPNLSDIYLSDFYIIPPCINLFSSKKLSMVFYGSLHNRFAASLSNFPFLETLVLKLSFRFTYKDMKLSSHSLKTLSIETLTDLDEIKIDTPNLLYFQYTSRKSDMHHRINNSEA